MKAEYYRRNDSLKNPDKEDTTVYSKEIGGVLKPPRVQNGLNLLYIKTVVTNSAVKNRPAKQRQTGVTNSAVKNRHTKQRQTGVTNSAVKNRPTKQRQTGVTNSAVKNRPTKQRQTGVTNSAVKNRPTKQRQTGVTNSAVETDIQNKDKQQQIVQITRLGTCTKPGQTHAYLRDYHNTDRSYSIQDPRFDDLEPSLNHTTCIYEKGSSKRMMCVTICDTDFCNGPHIDGGSTLQI
ncbi:unnamed protein product [Mytilus coruscus]|uniref:Uncharacterized protein n=1 Tax=Mytilus coruscus TaxID=42192 RepID=A0A6J8AW09_MYTCO|nr:unnamed protein product [Mytilus coruscus]